MDPRDAEIEKLRLQNVALSLQLAEAMSKLEPEVPLHKFVPLGKLGRAATFTGDAQSLSVLRRRVARSNFVVQHKPIASPGRSRAASVCLDGKRLVVVVDALSTGACVAADAHRRGFCIVHALSLEPSAELAAMVPAHLRGELRWAKELSVGTAPLEEGARSVCADLKSFAESRGLELCAVLAGAETGVKLADLLSELCSEWAPKVLSNGAAGADSRRNKWDMGEKVRASGTRAVRQIQTASWPSVEKWLADEWGLVALDAPCLLIVKPVESAGSDGVTACHCVADVKKAIGALVGATNGLGQKNESVLVQEFLQGNEFVVDGIQRDGVHKVCGLWAYDRRPTNGAGFVLHGQRFMSFDEPEVAMLAPYAELVLKALELNHGPSHMEVKLTPPPNGGSGPLSPCLVEVGARCHGAEGFWMSVVDECIGTNQADLTIDAYTDASAFAKIPVLPPPFKAFGTIKYLLVHRAGTLARVRREAIALIEKMESYRGHEVFVQEGRTVVPTQDCFTWGGVVKLANVNQASLQRDYDTIEQLCLDPNGLWDIH